MTIKNKKIISFFTIIIQIFSLFNFIYFSTNEVSAATNTWDFDLTGDYTYSSTTAFTITGSLANLNQNTLAHTGVITNATTYNGAYDVVVDGNYAYMTNYSRNSVSIINISNPEAPTFVSEIVNNGGTIRLAGASGIVKDGNYLYVTSYTGNAMQIINVTNPASPVAAGQVFNATTMAGARGITKVGNYVYVGVFTYDALQVINVTNPASPTIVGTYRQTTQMNGASEVKIYGSYAFVSAYNRDALSIIDISNPVSPTYVTQLRDTTNLNGARDIAITSDGNYAFVSAYLNNSVRVIDISIPATPTAITNISGGSYSINGPRDLDIDGDKLSIAGYTSNAVNMADITNPTTPVYITKILHNAANPLLQGVDGLFKIGNLVYCASYTSDALEILKFNYDTSSPYLQPTTAYNYGSDTISSFSEVLGGGNQGAVTYQISKNNGTTWYYWNGSAWTTTVGGVTNSSSAAIINSNLTSFNALGGGTNQFTFKAFFTSNGDQKVELDNVTLITNPPPTPGGVSTNLALWLKSNAGTSTTTDGASVTSWNDQSGNGLNAGGGVSPTFLNNSGTGHLNYNPLIDFDGTQYLENLANGANSRSYFAVIVPDQTVDGTLTGQVPFGWDCNSGVLSSGTCGLAFAGGVLGAFTVAMNDEVITHALGSSTNWRSAQIGAASYDAGSPMLVGFNENSGANGTDIYEKGIQIDNFTANTYQTLSSADYRIGRSMDGVNIFPYNGKIAEIVNYSNRVSDADRQKIESYLSLKYGMTINNGTSNYVASDGTTSIWNTTTAGTYTYDVFGIGRDNGSSLTQIKSKSTNLDGIVTINALGEGTNMSPSFVDIADKEFLSVSNNNSSNTWVLSGSPAGYNILSRQWRVQETGDVGAISIDFDIANTNFDVPVLMSGSTYYFIYDSNNNNNLSDETPSAMTNLGGNIWQVGSVNISNGMEFTLATQASSNNIPTNITLSNNTINENVASGSTIGTLTTTDADLGDSHTYSFVSGAGDTDNSKFSITGSTLKIAESPDYEIQSSYTVRLQTDDGHGGQYQKQFTININNLGEAINSILDFETSGKYTVTSGNWTRTLTNPQEGLYSIESNNGGLPNTQSCFEVTNTFTQTGTIDFFYNVSSEANDYLSFYIDNIQQQQWSGNVPWTQYTKNDITSGIHSYKWCYIKDAATNGLSDKAWVDYITFANTGLETNPPVISSINYASGILLPGGNHNIIINYNDAESGINITSDIISLYKWNGTVWGSDISAIGLNLGSKVITTTGATYPTNNLTFGKYKYDFQISDNNGNSSSTGAVFYIDEPEIIISTGSFNAGTITGTGLNFSSNEIIVTIKTVGASYQAEMSKDTNFQTSGGSIIIDWDGSSGVGYDKTTYTGINKNINSNPIIGTGSQNININGNKNTYTHNIKIGNLINLEQVAGTYTMNLSFRAIFGY